MRRPTQLITKSRQKTLLGAFFAAVKSLRLTQKFAARLIDVSSRALYTWRSGERRMLVRNARKVRLATLAMRELPDEERAKFRRSAKLIIAPREWAHVLRLRARVDSLIANFAYAKGETDGRDT